MMVVHVLEEALHCLAYFSFSDELLLTRSLSSSVDRLCLGLTGQESVAIEYNV